MPIIKRESVTHSPVTQVTSTDAGDTDLNLYFYLLLILHIYVMYHVYIAMSTYEFPNSNIAHNNSQGIDCSANVFVNIKANVFLNIKMAA